jgi:hypothetical protein
MLSPPVERFDGLAELETKLGEFVLTIFALTYKPGLAELGKSFVQDAGRHVARLRAQRSCP